MARGTLSTLAVAADGFPEASLAGLAGASREVVPRLAHTQTATHYRISGAQYARPASNSGVSALARAI